MPERTDSRQRSAEPDEPQLYLLGGTDELYLDEEGRVFYPGDAMPRTLTNAKRMSLQTAGITFGTEHPEPVAEPKALAPGEAAVAPSDPAESSAPEPRRSVKE